jgi:hypothetical protein
MLFNTHVTEHDMKTRSIRIHIVGCAPRSGTTLVYELITHCFEVQPFGKHEMSLFVDLKPRPPVYCSKSPNELVHVARVLRFDPSLYAIYVLRDPRDVVVSRHSKFPDKYWVDMSIWLRNQKLANKLGKNKRFITVRYEDLVSDPDAVQNLLCERMPFLNKLHDFSAYSELVKPSPDALLALRGVRPISQQSVGNWRNHLPRLKAQIQTYRPISEDLVRLGYETDDAWTSQLDGIVPNFERAARTASPVENPSGICRAFFRIRRRLRSLYLELRYVLRLSPHAQN